MQGFVSVLVGGTGCYRRDSLGKLGAGRAVGVTLQGVTRLVEARVRSLSFKQAAGVRALSRSCPAQRHAGLQGRWRHNILLVWVESQSITLTVLHIHWEI